MLRVLLTLAAGLLLALLVSSCGKEPVTTTPLGVPPPPSEFVFNGQADGLKGTEVVFSADSPLAPDKSAVWCSTVVMAWQEAKERLQTAKLDIVGSEALGQQLDSAPSARKMLPEEWYYVGFGETPDPGLPARLISELKVKFPDACEIDLPGDPTLPGFISLAYLRGGTVFDPPYDKDPEKLVFPAIDGNLRPVTCFGVNEETGYASHHVRVLATNLQGDPEPAGVIPELVVDLAAFNPRLEVVLAQLEPAESLEATWRKANELARGWEHGEDPAWTELGPRDTLAVPVVGFALNQLLMATLRIPDKPEWDGYPYLVKQQINFSLTEGGALVESFASCAPAAPAPSPPCGPRHFTFDRPFLIAMKLRAAEEPFFLMWVANAELMRKR